MKCKYALFVCSLSIAMLLGGCGSPSVEPIEEVQDVAAGDTQQEDQQEESTEIDENADVTEEETTENTEEADSETEETQEETEKEDAENADAENEEEKKDESKEQNSEDSKEAALLAYQEILNSAPALTGEHDEIYDAGFGYEDNEKLFGKHYDAFAIADINQDGTPELLIQSIINFRWLPLTIYTYSDGKAVMLRSDEDGTDFATFSQQSTANGAYISYICEDNHIHSVWNGTNPMGDAEETNMAYVLEGTTLKLVECNVGESENTTYIYDNLKENSQDEVDAIIQ